ncbi:MAG: DUF4402 domain-containing protein [Bacteroidales bacterium]
MKKSIIIIAAILMAGFSTKVMAQITRENTANSEIIAQLTIAKGVEFNFGKMAVLALTPGTCKISTSAARTATAGVTINTASSFTNATFDVTGLANATYAITMSSPITVSKGGGVNMTIDNLKLITTANATDRDATSTTSTLSGSGVDAITLGGTLNVAAGQAVGAYTGNFNLTVTYN